MLGPYRVLDLTDERGEIAGMVLGDLGADGIRVETPDGSPARRHGPMLASGEESLRSLLWGLKTPSASCSPPPVGVMEAAENRP